MRLRRLTLARQYLLLQMLIVVAVLVTVAAITLAQTGRSVERAEGRRALGAAENLAKQTLVRNDVPQALPGHDKALAAAAETNRSVSGSSLVAIAALDGTVLVSSDPTLVAERLPVGDGSTFVGRSWSGRADVAGVEYVVATVPVQHGETGEVIGVVAVGRRFPSAWDRLLDAVPNLLIYLGVATALGLIGSVLLARRVKRQTLGMEPAEIAALVEHREALLYGVKEGVLALDLQHRVTVVNDGAVQLLGLPPGCTGRTVEELGVDEQVLEVLTQAQPGPDRLALVGDRVISFNRRPMRLRGKVIGTVTTMRDRTELSALEDELGTTRATTDTLRAQTHEFANQLHVISGLLELAQVEEAQQFVDGVRLTRTRTYDEVTARVADAGVAALVIAKSSLAAERGVDLRLDPDSRLGPVGEELSRDLTTVVGNLLDNALDAVADRLEKIVALRLGDDDGCLVVTVRDSGPGVPGDHPDLVFTQGYSTKPSGPGGRGFGLALVRLVCRRRGGDVTVRNDGGAVFEASLGTRVAAR